MSYLNSHETHDKPVTVLEPRPRFVNRPFISLPRDTFSTHLSHVDLFAGIGGFHAGIKSAAAEFGYGVSHALGSEVDPHCRATYERNYGHLPEGDVLNIQLRKFPKSADVLTAGFPCQPFSNSGRKLGLSDPRGQFFEVIREMILHFRPRVFILENVPGMTTSGGSPERSILADGDRLIGAAMQRLERELVKLDDYEVTWFQTDSSWFSSPQVRRRVYIVGLHRDFGPLPSFEFQQSKSHTFWDVKEDLGHRDFEQFRLTETQTENILRTMRKRPPSNHLGMRRVGQAYLCEGGNVGQAYHARGKVPTLTKIWARFLPIYFPHGNAIRHEVGDFEPNGLYGKGKIRRATVKEVMRLQGFPDSFKPHPRPGLAYEHAGNAVNAKVIYAITHRILSSILSKRGNPQIRFGVAGDQITGSKRSGPSLLCP
jgi:DNA (cytosine-5)-methyltransferase 1